VDFRQFRFIGINVSNAAINLVEFITFCSVLVNILTGIKQNSIKCQSIETDT
jgi:hypothetical protein